MITQKQVTIQKTEEWDKLCTLDAIVLEKGTITTIEIPSVERTFAEYAEKGYKSFKIEAAYDANKSPLLNTRILYGKR